MTQKEMTAHIRNRIKVAGIKARVRMVGRYGIQVFTPTYEARFTVEEIRTINQIAIDNKLTQVYGYPIDIETAVQLTEKIQWEFYL